MPWTATKGSSAARTPVTSCRSAQIRESTGPGPTGRALTLREHLAGLSDQSAEALVFPSQRGTPLNADNLRRRIFKPLAEEVGAGWAGFHSLIHSFASLQLARGVNLLQLSQTLGHHSPAFTLSTYVHLLDGGVGDALDLKVELPQPEPEATTLRVVAAA